MYHTITLPVLNETIIVRDADGATIPNDPENQDYVDYVRWQTEQTPEAGEN